MTDKCYTKSWIKPLRSISMVLCCTWMIHGSIHAQSNQMWSEVHIVDNANQVTLYWIGSEGTPANDIEYRIKWSEDWIFLSVPAESQSTTIHAELAPGKTYEWRFKDSDELSADFRTFSIMTSDPSDAYINTIVAVASTSSFCHVIHDRTLQFAAEDEYNTEELWQANILNNNEQLVERVALHKTDDGIYNIDLATLAVSWVENSEYHIELTDGLNPKKEIRFQVVAPDEDGIEVTIIANPIVLDCMAGNKSSIDYYSEFSGGKAPYTVTWSIANGDDFSLPLLPPQKSVVSSDANVPKINVEFPLSYLVVVTVTDECGHFGEYALLMSCEEEEEDEQSILFERIGYDNKNNIWGGIK